MPVWASTLLSVALGAGVTYLASIQVEAKRRLREEERNRRRALARYLGRLTIAISFIREWPEELPPSARERVRKATWERSARVRSSDWVRSQKEMREILGPEPYRPIYRLIEAYSALRFVGLDERVWREVVRTIDYIERLAKDRSQAALDAWPDLRMALFDAIREAGDDVAIESVVESERLADVPGSLEAESPSPQP